MHASFLIDKKKFRATVVWLEDQRVRHLKPEEREALRDTESDGWDDAWSDYLQQLGCDSKVYQNRKNQLMWLMGRATQLYFAERADDIRAKQEQKEKKEEESNANSKEDKDPFEGVNGKFEWFLSLIKF